MYRLAMEAPSADRSSSEMLELARDECLRLLGANSFGRLAVSMGEGPPVIRPVNYVFDQGSQSVAFRTATGSKLHALLKAARAAFEIDGVDEASRTGWSVIIVGVTEEVTSPNELRHLNALGLDTWASGSKAHWVRVRARAVSGRRIALVSP
jgi:nitroimidazol reductase NimA-like FMN-containing flavoprotein (pyridoxamine 5'-phosphate oxidase superfamily)